MVCHWSVIKVLLPMYMRGTFKDLCKVILTRTSFSLHSSHICSHSFCNVACPKINSQFIHKDSSDIGEKLDKRVSSRATLHIRIIYPNIHNKCMSMTKAFQLSLHNTLSLLLLFNKSGIETIYSSTMNDCSSRKGSSPKRLKFKSNFLKQL